MYCFSFQLRKQVAEDTEKQRNSEHEREVAEQKVLEVLFGALLHHSYMSLFQTVTDDVDE